VREIRFTASKSAGEVGGLVMIPESPRRMLVLAHGAGAGMRHAFMEALAVELAARNVATLRYQFPYMERKTGRPDPKPILFATVRAAVAAAAEAAPGLPLLAGGKSMGGRMTSMAAAEEPLAGIGGIIFVGFPLHPAGSPSTERGDHLARVTVPMLFLEGTRDALADLDLLRPITRALGDRAALHVIDGADHSFHVLKRSGRTDADVLAELASTVAAWGETRG